MLDIKRVIASRPRKPSGERPRELLTPWGERLLAGEAPAPAHPNPQLERDRWASLDGMWEYAVVPAGEGADEAWRAAEPPAAWDGEIRVPFSPEAPLSGVGRQVKPDELLWYRRRVAPSELPEHVPGDRLILHFEAVDHACACYADGVRVGEHVGAYLPFSFDITDAARAAARAGADLELALCVWDPSDAGTQPRGKQRLARGGIWYTAQSGIWQAVWLEAAPAARIVDLALDADADAGELRVTARLALPAERHDGEPPRLRVSLADDPAVEAVSEPVAPSAESDGGDGVRSVAVTLGIPRPHLWSPDDPYLYRLDLAFGEDRVRSYAAFRTVTMERDERGALRLCLNHEPLFIRGLLDQGYWSDGLMTAPADDALVFDIETARDLGFNLLRKHIKVESRRFYHHCDCLGMLVMQDMPSGGGAYSAWHTSYKPTFLKGSWGGTPDDSPEAHRALAADDPAYRREWTETCEGAVRLLAAHPSIVAWCLFNEGWGQFDARAAAERVRELDPTRAIDAVSGWYDQRCGDFQSVHNYFRPLEVYPDEVEPPRAFLISEFGGCSLAAKGHCAFDEAYGYAVYEKRRDLSLAVRGLLMQVESLERRGLAGFVYTQLSDVEEEVNGLVTYDRRVVKLKG